MCKSRLLTFSKCFKMLTQFAFRAKMLYICISEEERALNTGLSPLFFGHYKGRNTSEVGNSRCFCGNFLGFIGARIDDVEIFSRPKI